MLTLGIILIAIAIVCLVISLRIALVNKEQSFSLLLILIICFIMGYFTIGIYIGERKASINAIKGKNNYEQIINYESLDTVLVKTDTIYRRKTN